LIGLWIKGQKYHGDNLFDAMAEKDDLPVFDDTKKWLDDYFAGKQPALLRLALAPIGGEFRQKVWRILCQIPYGKTSTYKDIAKEVKCKSAQAVGGAVGHNPISIIIPCHRVVGVNGSLTGYAGGIKTKIKLLELEGADISELFMPKMGRQDGC
jgi:methylated-DNA-[protein]-cysteine S-methyltransferase